MTDTQVSAELKSYMSGDDGLELARAYLNRQCNHQSHDPIYTGQVAPRGVYVLNTDATAAIKAAIDDLTQQLAEARCIVSNVAEQINEGSGFWCSCSGCYETNEGYPTSGIDPVFKCERGSGCSECGGIGAVWDTTDYAHMAAEILDVPHDTAQPPAPVDGVSAAKDVLAERQRQVSVEGWTTKHDDEHAKGEMAEAAACYALYALKGPPALIGDVRSGNGRPIFWPWSAAWWKPKGQRADLVRAGALIIAEIERLDRAALSAGEV